MDKNWDLDSLILNILGNVSSLGINHTIPGISGEMFSFWRDFKEFRGLNYSEITTDMPSYIKNLDLNSNKWVPNDYQFYFFSNISDLLLNQGKSREESLKIIEDFGYFSRDKLMKEGDLDKLVKITGNSMENLMYLPQDFTYLTTLFRKVNVFETQKIGSNTYQITMEVLPSSWGLKTIEETLRFYLGATKRVLELTGDKIEEVTFDYNKLSKSCYITAVYDKKVEKKSILWQKGVSLFMPQIYFRRFLAKKENKNLELLVDRNLDLVESFNKDIFNRDNQTGLHVSGVTFYAYLLSYFLGFDDSELRISVLSGLLHDIGKNAIPDRVLKKNGKFNSLERIIMEAHGPIGWVKLDEFNMDHNFILEEEIVNGTYEHHENSLGSGYLFSLDPNLISPNGKILQFSDIYHALSQRRYYKDELSSSQIFEELEKFDEGFFNNYVFETAKEFLSPFLENYFGNDFSDSQISSFLQGELKEDDFSMFINDLSRGLLTRKRFLKKISELGLNSEKLEEISNSFKAQQYSPRSYKETKQDVFNYFKLYKQKIITVAKLVELSKVPNGDFPEELAQLVSLSESPIQIHLQMVNSLSPKSKSIIEGVKLEKDNVAFEALSKLEEYVPILKSFIRN